MYISTALILCCETQPHEFARLSAVLWFLSITNPSPGHVKDYTLLSFRQGANCTYCPMLPKYCLARCLYNIRLLCIKSSASCCAKILSGISDTKWYLVSTLSSTLELARFGILRYCFSFSILASNYFKKLWSYYLPPWLFSYWISPSHACFQVFQKAVILLFAPILHFIRGLNGYMIHYTPFLCWQQMAQLLPCLAVTPIFWDYPQSDKR